MPSGPPPSPWEVANDLAAQARVWDRTGHDHLERSLRRGASTIRDLMSEIARLKQEAGR